MCGTSLPCASKYGLLQRWSRNLTLEGSHEAQDGAESTAKRGAERRKTRAQAAAESQKRSSARSAGRQTTRSSRPNDEGQGESRSTEGDRVHLPCGALQ